MKAQELADCITEYVNTSPENRILPEDAIRPDIAGMKIYDSPLVAFASADDRLFTEEFKKAGVIHPEYMAPQEWLSSARTVISFFLPFTDTVKKSNRCRTDEPYEPGIPQRCSPEWLHGRIEGQMFVARLCEEIETLLRDEGFETVCPSVCGKLRMITPFISTWSERHAAYAAGLGTFGLSKGLITEKGMAGRFGSVITNAEFPATERPYSDPFEYCIMCGKCMERCPAGAINIERGCALGKDQLVCGPYVAGGKLPPHGPNQRVRYGCGKCQVGVPCESGIPGRK